MSLGSTLLQLFYLCYYYYYYYYNITLLNLQYRMAVLANFFVSLWHSTLPVVLIEN